MSIQAAHIHFKKASHQEQDIIFQWLLEPHMQEFWDNSQEHKDDIVNFINGRKEKSNYFNGMYTYWVGFIDDAPYCFILSNEESDTPDLPTHYRPYLSKHGKTLGLDFGIGNRNYLGKGLAAPTLLAFIDFYRREVDAKVDTFFIDPSLDNPRAIHAYQKAGFLPVTEFIQKGYFDQKPGLLMVYSL